MRKLLLIAAALSACASVAVPTLSSATPAPLESRALIRASVIRTDLTGRYRSLPQGGLAVTEASSTGVVESFTLVTPDLLDARMVPADDGIWYAICPIRATCPYPARRVARPAADLVSRRLALELAVRTFLDTSAELVAVSLPTPRFIAFIAERDELAHEVDLRDLANALAGDPSRGLSMSLRAIVDRVTRPRVFIWLGLEPTLNGRDSWVGMARWTAP
jgi:hypothetical protein